LFRILTAAHYARDFLLLNLTIISSAVSSPFFTFSTTVLNAKPSLGSESIKRLRRFRDRFGHTPLSIEEEIPWKCRRLVIGTGTGALPVMEEVNSEAHRRKIKLQILPTAEAIKILEKDFERTNAILHLTC
jgi:hypothetical protein